MAFANIADDHDSERYFIVMLGMVCFSNDIQTMIYLGGGLQQCNGPGLGMSPFAEERKKRWPWNKKKKGKQCQKIGRSPKVLNTTANSIRCWTKKQGLGSSSDLISAKVAEFWVDTINKLAKIIAEMTKPRFEIQYFSLSSHHANIGAASLCTAMKATQFTVWLQSGR